MRWLLAGCWGLALIHLSVSLQLYQRPRFYRVKPNRDNLMIHCVPSKKASVTVEWYKDINGQMDPLKIQNESRFEFRDSLPTINGILMIRKVYMEDDGAYFCKVKEVWGPGTTLKVVRLTDPDVAVYRSKMKDGLIVLQALLLATCIAAMMLHRQKLLQKEDSVYEEPETDHIYEGLAIETCGGDLYEELPAYAQVETTEAPWE